jgi:protein TonB
MNFQAMNLFAENPLAVNPLAEKSPALHLPQPRGLARWIAAAAVIVAAHAAPVALLVMRSNQVQSEPNIPPAIAVSLAPVEASSPSVQDQDVAIGPAMQQADAVQEQPKTEEKPVEQPVEAPQQQAEVALPREEPKEVEKPQETPQTPVPETRAPPKTDHIGQFTEASSNAYNALVFGHLQRFKRYPRDARGAAGTTVVKFVLNRSGEVLESAVTKSSGNAVLDREALEILRRSSPFPPFPAAKPGARDTYVAPVNFAH